MRLKIKLRVPIGEEEIIRLKVGDKVLLSGVIVTARDVAHKYIIEHFVDKSCLNSRADELVYKNLKKYLTEGIIYHCGPVVKEEGGEYTFLAAGPTTSMREEPYQADVMKCFGLRGVIGKGGMGVRTLKGCVENRAVYFHAVGGAAVLIGESVKEVLGVECLDFGTPEAFWIIRVDNFPCIVTMDSHGESLHQRMIEESGEKMKNIFQ